MGTATVLGPQLWAGPTTQTEGWTEGEEREGNTTLVYPPQIDTYCLSFTAIGDKTGLMSIYAVRHTHKHTCMVNV